MIAYVSGTLAEKKPTEAVIDVGGLGYRLLIPTSSFDKLPAKGESARLHATLIVREDSQTLYGFATEAERQVFETMISVSGVGPKLALAALSGMSPGELRDVVLAGDTGMLTRIPGVGKKTAERLIVELRDKLSKLDGLGTYGAVAGDGEAAQARSDARAGLEALGLGRAEAEKRIRVVLRDHPGVSSAEDLIRIALRPT
ncbi:MAG: Holliday junction branch migration protein RuvA [Bacteroidetes bacterium]|nr:Holliday junction branch migration protein RuvA [Bacteroidota bacterium]